LVHETSASQVEGTLPARGIALELAQTLETSFELQLRVPTKPNPAGSGGPKGMRDQFAAATLLVAANPEHSGKLRPP